MRWIFVFLAFALAGCAPTGAPDTASRTEDKVDAKAARQLFAVNFDNLSAVADQAGGDRKSSLKRDMGLDTEAGFHGQSLLLKVGEDCTYATKGNLDLSGGLVSFWVRPYDWDNTAAGRIPLFRVQGKVDGKTQVMEITAKAGSVIFGFRGMTTFEVSTPVTWRKATWYQVAAVWNDREAFVSVNGRPGKFKKFKNGETFRFPALAETRFALVPEPQNGRTAIDEVRIFSGSVSADTVLGSYLSAIGADILPPVITVPRCAGVKIDGRLDDAAWKRASRLPIMTRNRTIMPYAHTAFVSLLWDEKQLYVGCFSPIVDGQVAATVKAHDGPVWQDDAFEVFLTPAAKGSDRYFHWIFNSLGAVFDCIGTGEKSWNSTIPIRTFRGRDFWTVEMAIPYAQISAGVPEIGTVWRANFARDWRLISKHSTAWTIWAYTGLSFLENPERHGKLIFADEKSGVRYRLGDGVRQGDIAVHLQAGSRVKAEIEVLDKKQKTVKKSTTFRGRSTLRITVGDATTGTITLRAANMKGEEVVAYRTRFRVRPPLSFGVVPQVEANRIQVLVDLSNLSSAWLAAVKEGRVKLAAEIVPRKGEVLLRSGTPRIAEYAFTFPCDWRKNHFQVKVRLKAAGLNDLRAEHGIEVPDLPWINNKLGVSHDVLEPWTPLVCQGTATVSCWGRKYEFDGPFMKSVTNQNREQLRGPVRLLLCGPGGREAFLANAGRVKHKAGDRIEWQGTGKFRHADIKVDWSAWMEYDGLVVSTITLTPPAGGVEVDSLSLSIPLRKDIVKYVRGMKSQTSIRSGHDTVGGKPWQSGFEPVVWVTNDREGFLYFCESDANWVYSREQAKAASVVRVRKGLDAGIFLNIISRAVRFTRPLTYRFGFQATPVKPMLPRRRHYNFGQHAAQPYKNMQNWFTLHANPTGTWDVARPAVLRKWDQDLKARGITQLYYAVTSCTPDNTAAYRLFKTRWSSPFPAMYGPYDGKASRWAPAVSPYYLQAVCPGDPSFQDMLLYTADRIIREVGVSGLYTDTDGIFVCENPHHGHGYTDAFGRRGLTWTILSKRRFAKRLATICRTAGKDRVLWKTHAHAKLIPPVHCFADMWYPGEELTGRLFGNRFYYIKDMDPDVWHVDYRGDTSGIAHYFLPEFIRGTKDKTDDKQPQPTESLIAMLAVNDIDSSSSYCHKPSFSEWWGLRKKLGLLDSEFIGYWRRDCPVKAITPAALASVHLTPSGVVIPIANRNSKATVIRVRLDLDWLGFKGGRVTAADARTGKQLSLRGNVMEVPVKGYNYTYVTVGKAGQ